VIFNRSHYEDVLVPQVRGWLRPAAIEKRLAHIRNFEAMLHDENITVLKCFLHISKAEQKKLAAAMKNAKQCNSMGKQCKDSCNGGAPPKNLMDLLKKNSKASNQKSSLSKSISACKNPGAGGGAKPGSGSSKPTLADEPDTKPKQFNTEQVMSESQDIDAEPIARDFVQGNATTTQEATRKLTVIEHQVQAGLEEGSEEDQVPAALREAHQKYFSEWKKKIDQVKSNSSAPEVAPQATPATTPTSNAPALPPKAP
jgi:hypothetical protein